MKQSVTKRAMPAPPRGSLDIRLLFEFLNSLLQSVRETAPHHRRYAAELPPGGEATKWLSIFAEFSFREKMRQGEGYIKGIYLNFKRFAKFRYEAPEGRYLNMRRRIKPTKNATIAETTDFITSNALSRLLFSFSRG